MGVRKQPPGKWLADINSKLRSGKTWTSAITKEVNYGRSQTRRWQTFDLACRFSTGWP